MKIVKQVLSVGYSAEAIDDLLERGTQPSPQVLSSAGTAFPHQQFITFQAFSDSSVCIRKQRQKNSQVIHFEAEGTDGKPLFYTSCVVWERIKFGRQGQNYALIPHATVLVSQFACYDYHKCIFQLFSPLDSLRIITAFASECGFGRLVLQDNSKARHKFVFEQGSAWVPPFTDWRWMKQIDTVAIVTFVAALLLDKSIILVSQNRSLAAQLVAMARFILQPFSIQKAVFTNFPNQFASLLQQAERHFVIALKSADFHLGEDCICINLDTNQIKSLQRLPQCPELAQLFKLFYKNSQLFARCNSFQDQIMAIANFKLAVQRLLYGVLGDITQAMVFSKRITQQYQLQDVFNLQFYQENTEHEFMRMVSRCQSFSELVCNCYSILHQQKYKMGLGTTCQKEKIYLSRIKKLNKSAASSVGPGHSGTRPFLINTDLLSKQLNYELATVRIAFERQDTYRFISAKQITNRFLLQAKNPKKELNILVDIAQYQNIGLFPEELDNLMMSSKTSVVSSSGKARISLFQMDFQIKTIAEPMRTRTPFTFNEPAPKLIKNVGKIYRPLIS